MLHGIYGAGRNWASVMRRVVEARPEWGAVLIDLRQHGASQGFPPPHTVEAAAADLEALALHTGMDPAVVVGHSFGGKVALLYARRAPTLRQVWVIDSTPEAREPGGSAWSMLNLLRSLPGPFTSRDELIEALTGHGVNRGVAEWMATNLQAERDAYRWRFDFDAMEELLLSFFASDAWDVVESPRDGLDVHIVRADDSTVLDGPALARVEAAAAAGSVKLHRVGGGHWVNAENPQAIEELLVQNLPGSSTGDS
ncbi:MAG: alpha/beta hydrolase [Gemmatimonadota bacterium]